MRGRFRIPQPFSLSRLKDGLLAYAPVCPTPECVAAVRKLEARHGARNPIRG